MKADKIKLVGVVTPYNRYFDLWVKEVGMKMYGDGFKFIRLSKIDDIRGLEFHTIEKGYRYYEVGEDIYNNAVLRIK